MNTPERQLQPPEPTWPNEREYAAITAQARREIECEAQDLDWWLAQWDDYRAPPGWVVTGICTDYWWAYKAREGTETGRHAREVVEHAVQERVREMMEEIHG